MKNKRTALGISFLKIISFSVIVSLVSCEDILEENPRGFLNERTTSLDLTESQLTDAQSTIYLTLRGSEENNEPRIYNEGGYVTRWADVGVDETAPPTFGSNRPPARWVYSYSPDNRDAFDMWTAHYNSIEVISSTIQSFEQNTTKGEELSESQIRVNQLVADGKFARAILYFNLVKMFESPILVNRPTPNNVRELLDTPPLGNSTPKQIYEFVISELEEVISLLPSVTNSAVAASNQNIDLEDYGIVSPYAAHALLGKVYLQIAGNLKNQVIIDPTIFNFEEDANFFYNKAVENFDIVIESGQYALMEDYAKVFDPNFEGHSSNTEMLFAVRYVSTGTGGGSNFGSGDGPAGRPPNGSFTVNNAIREFAYSFFDNKEDVINDTGGIIFGVPRPSFISDGRFLVNIAPFRVDRVNTTSNPQDATLTTPNLWGSYKYRRELPVAPGTQGDLDLDFPYLRYADVLLSKAEALINSGGDLAMATEYINQVRRRAFRTTKAGANTLDADYDRTTENLGYLSFGHNIQNFDNSDPFNLPNEDRPVILPGRSSDVTGGTGGVDVDVPADQIAEGPLLEFLLRERRKEFFFEGHRKDDLIRNGVFFEVLRTVGRGRPSVYSEIYPENTDFSGNTVNSGRGIPLDGLEDHEYRLPIPQRNIELNPELKQNIGY